MPQYNLIIPNNLKPQPDIYEHKVAQILSVHFQSNILFVLRSDSATPDIQIASTKQFWEIKNIRGNSKNTIEDNIRKASRQSNNIVISLLRSKMPPEQAASRIKFYLHHSRTNINNILLITKHGKIIDLSP